MRKSIYETSKSVKQRFALRKLSVGVLSVLIGFATIGGVAPTTSFAASGVDKAAMSAYKVNNELQKSVEKWKHASVDSYIYKTSLGKREIMGAFETINNAAATVTELENAVSVLDAAEDAMLMSIKHTTAKSVSPEVINKLKTLFTYIDQKDADESYNAGIANYMKLAVQNGKAEEAKASQQRIQESADLVMYTYNHIDEYKKIIENANFKDSYREFINSGNIMFQDEYDTEGSVISKEAPSGYLQDAKDMDKAAVTPINVSKVEKNLNGKVTIDAKYGKVTKDGIELKKGLGHYIFKLNISQTKDFNYYDKGKVTLSLGDEKLGDDVVSIKNGDVAMSNGYFVTFRDHHVSFYTDEDQFNKAVKYGSVARYGDFGYLPSSREITVTIKANDKIKKAIENGKAVTRFTVAGERATSHQNWESNASFINGDSTRSTLSFVESEVVPENPGHNVIPWTSIQPIPVIKDIERMFLNKNITEDGLKIVDEGLLKVVKAENPAVNIKSVKIDRNFIRKVGLQKLSVLVTFDNGSSRVVKVDCDVLSDVTPENPDTSSSTGNVSVKTGWHKEKNGKWSYVDENHNVVKGRVIKIGANSFGFDNNGIMRTGWFNDNETWYYFNKIGEGTEGAMLKSEWKKVSGKWYYFKEDGKMASNEMIGSYYFNKSGAWSIDKWIKSGNRYWYSLKEGGYAKNGFKEINNNKYYFDGSGWMQTGWIYEGGTWYYFNKQGEGTEGSMAKGWKKISSKWYYFKEDGKMASNETIGSYYLNKSGAWSVDKWIKSGSRYWYSLKEGGYANNGFKDINNNKYYFDGSGWMKTGWLHEKGTWYYFNKQGEGTEGAMAKGWKKIGGKWYYFYKDGKMAKNTTIGGWKVNASGAYVK